MIAPGPPVSASVWRTTRPSCLQVHARRLGQPHRLARGGVAEVNVNMLRASFIRVPAPGSPAWITIDAHCLKAGLIRSYTSRSAPTMMASSPFSAATGTAADRRVDDVNALRRELFGQLGRRCRG